MERCSISGCQALYRHFIDDSSFKLQNNSPKRDIFTEWATWGSERLRDLSMATLLVSWKLSVKAQFSVSPPSPRSSPMTGSYRLKVLHEMQREALDLSKSHSRAGNNWKEKKKHRLPSIHSKQEITLSHELGCQGAFHRGLPGSMWVGYPPSPTHSP